MRKNNTLKRVCFLGLLFSFTNVLPSQSDDESRWLNLAVQPVAGHVSHSYRASEVSKEERRSIRGVPENLENVRVSKNILSLELNMHQLLKHGKIDSLVFYGRSFSEGAYSSDDHKWRLFGVRATKGESEVLIIDSDLDLRFDDEEIIFLPKPVLDRAIPYSEKYPYPGDTNFVFDVTYEHLVNHQVHPVQTRLSFTVNTTYDPEAEQLVYKDNFAQGFVNKLIYNGKLDGEKLTIEVNEACQWREGSAEVLVRTGNGSVYELYKTDRFQMAANGPFYRIDSVDFLNQRILIRKQPAGGQYLNLKGGLSFQRGFYFY